MRSGGLTSKADGPRVPGARAVPQHSRNPVRAAAAAVEASLTALDLLSKAGQRRRAEGGEAEGLGAQKSRTVPIARAALASIFIAPMSDAGQSAPAASIFHSPLYMGSHCFSGMAGAQAQSVTM